MIDSLFVVDLQNIGGRSGEFGVSEESPFRSSTGTEVFLQKNFSLETHRDFHHSNVGEKLREEKTTRNVKKRKGGESLHCEYHRSIRWFVGRRRRPDWARSRSHPRNIQ